MIAFSWAGDPRPSNEGLQLLSVGSEPGINCQCSHDDSDALITLPTPNNLCCLHVLEVPKVFIDI